MGVSKIEAELAALLAPGEFHVTDGRAVVRAQTVEHLAAAMRWALATASEIRWDRSGFPLVEGVEPKGCLVGAGGAAPLHEVEAHLSRTGLTLGPLSPRASRLDVASWLEGPHAGLRPIAGGRLETAALTLEVALRSGEVYRSHPSPRSAAGPNLDFLLLGGAGSLGLLTRATLRAFPKATAEAEVCAAISTPTQAVQILRDALAHEAVPSVASLAMQEGAQVLRVRFENLAFRVHRDAERFRAAASAAGAKVLAHPSALDAPLRAHEVEVEWEALAAVLAIAGPEVELHRIARESVVLASPLALEGEGLVSLEPSSTPPREPWFEAIRQAQRGAP